MTDQATTRRPTTSTSDVSTITLDLSTLTLGEMAEAERQSNRSFDDLLRAGTATRRLVAVFVAELRSSERPRSWLELSSLRLRDAQSSTSQPGSDSPSPTSSD